MKKIAFLATSRSGLGHLRRVCNIAGRLKHDQPALHISLISNASPKGLSGQDASAFDTVIYSERDVMASELVRHSIDLAVADTIVIPNMGQYQKAAALILRETPQNNIARFHRDDGKPWDLVILPNPQDHWMPNFPAGFAKRVEAAGWILRATGIRHPADISAGIVVATGGGGTLATRAELYPVLEDLIARARELANSAFLIRQALGPRSGQAALAQADETFDPGGDLNAVFRQADLVLSTAGYNSVLELASTDTPTLLVSIPRSLDDQLARVRLWGPKLGWGLELEKIHAAAEWLADQIDKPRRRMPVELGLDGALGASKAIADLMCPVS